MIGFLLDQVPWWLYAIVLLIGVGVLFYLFSPVLVPIWNATPLWIKVAIGAVIGVFLAFVKGRNVGHDNAVKEQERRNERGVQKREEIHKEVKSLDRAAVDKRLDKFMRD
jgi:xanthine/uracil/vitamin C permease (AzgA family)